MDIMSNSFKMHDLRDQLVRIRLYGPLSMAIVADSLKLAQTDTSFRYRFTFQNVNEHFNCIIKYKIICEIIKLVFGVDCSQWFRESASFNSDDEKSYTMLDQDPRNQQSTVNSYVLRDRHALNVLSKWMQGKHKLPELIISAEILSTHMNALIPVELECVARGKPKRFGIVCLPTNEDILKIKRRQIEGPVLITQTPRRHVSNEQESSENMDEEESSKLECETKAKWQADMWKDVVSTDQTTRMSKEAALSSSKKMLC
uniref:HORMA domain-containing protein n=1 Tax=Heterorhabditis bacteriophora TaxID=37862 RepID=A0A1I7WKR7_HETBA